MWLLTATDSSLYLMNNKNTIASSLYESGTEVSLLKWAVTATFPEEHSMRMMRQSEVADLPCVVYNYDRHARLPMLSTFPNPSQVVCHDIYFIAQFLNLKFFGGS